MLNLVTASLTSLAKQADVLSLLDTGFKTFLGWQRASAMNTVLTYVEAAAKILGILAAAAPAAKVIISLLISVIGRVYNLIQTMLSGKQVEVNDEEQEYCPA